MNEKRDDARNESREMDQADIEVAREIGKKRDETFKEIRKVIVGQQLVLDLVMVKKLKSSRRTKETTCMNILEILLLRFNQI